MLSYSIRKENMKNPPRCDQMLIVSLLHINMLKYKMQYVNLNFFQIQQSMTITVKVTNGTSILVMSDASMCSVSKSHFVSIQLKNLELNYFKGIYIGMKITGMNHLTMFSGT